MSRVERVTGRRASPAVRATYAVIRRTMRKLVGRAVVPVPYEVMAHSPSIMQAYGMLERALAGSKAAPLDLRELARGRVSMLVGCPW